MAASEALWRGEEFILGLDRVGRVTVALQQGCGEESVLKGYLLACYAFHRLHQQRRYLASMYAALMDEIAAEALQWFARMKNVITNTANSGAIVLCALTASLLVIFERKPFRISSGEKWLGR